MAFFIVNSIKEFPRDRSGSRLLSEDQIVSVTQEYFGLDNEEVPAGYEGAVPVVHVFLRFSMKHSNIVDRYVPESQLPQYPENRPSEIWVAGTLQQFLSSLVKATAQAFGSCGSRELKELKYKCLGTEGNSLQFDELIDAELMLVSVDGQIYLDYLTLADFQEVNFDKETGAISLGGDTGDPPPNDKPTWRLGTAVKALYYPTTRETLTIIKSSTDISVYVPGGQVIDSLWVLPESPLAAFNAGITGSGSEIFGPEDVAADPVGRVFVINQQTGAGMTIYFTGITSPTQIKMQFKL